MPVRRVQGVQETRAWCPGTSWTVVSSCLLLCTHQPRNFREAKHLNTRLDHGIVECARRDPCHHLLTPLDLGNGYRLTGQYTALGVLLYVLLVITIKNEQGMHIAQAPKLPRSSRCVKKTEMTEPSADSCHSHFRHARNKWTGTPQ